MVRQIMQQQGVPLKLMHQDQEQSAKMKVNFGKHHTIQHSVLRKAMHLLYTRLLRIPPTLQRVRGFGTHL
jgi:hypothetical protein